MSVDGTAAADPRTFLVVKYKLIKAVFVHFNSVAVWSQEMQVDVMTQKFASCGVAKDIVRTVCLS